jgi:hypothetical protein
LSPFPSPRNGKKILHMSPRNPKLIKGINMVTLVQKFTKILE